MTNRAIHESPPASFPSCSRHLTGMTAYDQEERDLSLGEETRPAWAVAAFTALVLLAVSLAAALA